MSVFVFGSRVHGATCTQAGGHPPVLCGCRVLQVPVACDDPDLAGGRSVRPSGPPTLLGRAVSNFLHHLDRDVA